MLHVHIGKEDIKMPFFVDNMIAYLENPRDSTGKQLRTNKISIRLTYKSLRFYNTVKIRKRIVNNRFTATIKKYAPR